jgi:phosphoglycolate phosphatase
MGKYMKKLVIFDLDGTLLNTLADLGDAINHAIATVGVPPYTLETIETFIGNGTQKMFERALGERCSDEALAQCIEVYSEYYGQNYNVKTCAYDGVARCVELLNKNGVMVGVVTNKLDEMAVKLCREHFGDVFFGVIGDLPGFPRKPDPSKIFKMMADADAGECVIVGDSTVDVQTAKNAGLPCVAVSWGFNSRDKLESACPEYIAENEAELIDCLEKVLKTKLVD